MHDMPLTAVPAIFAMLVLGGPAHAADYDLEFGVQTQFMSNQARQQQDKPNADYLLPSIFGWPDQSASSGNEIEDMFARWFKSYGR